jgi:hypothetical protein
MRSRFRDRAGQVEAEEHDVSKELFLGIMMLTLTLGILILNVSQPVWRVHHHDPAPQDVVVVFTSRGPGLSPDGQSVSRMLQPGEFEQVVGQLVSQPDRNLHLFLRGGSRERMVNEAAYADSLLSTAPDGSKVRPAVYVHMW